MLQKKKWAFWGAVVVAVLLAIPLYSVISPFFMSFFLGVVLAIICRPLYQWFIKILKGKPAIAATLTTLAVFLGIMAPLFFLVWFAAKDLIQLVQSGSLVDSIQGWFDPTKTPLLLERSLDWLEKITRVSRDELMGHAVEFAKSAGLQISKMVASWITSIPQMLIWIFVATASLFYLFIDWKDVTDFISDLTPLTKAQQSSIYQTFESTCRAVVLGTLSAALVQGVLIGLAFLIFTVPQALLFMFVGFFMAMVPFVGTAPVWIGGVIYLFVEHHTGLGVGLILSGLFISGIDNVIKAYVVSGKARLHPLLVFISVIGGLGAFGLTGLFLGPILMAVFISVLKILAQTISTQSA